MAVFSKRNGYNENDIKLEYASDALKRRIFVRFYKQEFDYYDTIDWTNYTTSIEDMMIELGIPYEFPQNLIMKKKNAETLEKYVMASCEWYLIFDFIEKYLNICDIKTKCLMQDEFNRILEDEASAYRVVDKTIVPIINESELAALEDAKKTKYDSVNKHFEKALAFFADRRKPDYENSIKESISAVESMCCVITGLSGPTATLGKTIKKLKDSGIHIHPAMESAFSSLYGYASDEDGIRHGGIDFISAPAEDAKYMLVSCSAFINYLIEKWSKVQH